MPRPENELTTILDMHSVLADLVEKGLGELPVQMLLVPDSTMQALSRQLVAEGPDLPAAMMELTPDNGAGRIPVIIVNVSRLGGSGGKRTAVQ